MRTRDVSVVVLTAGAVGGALVYLTLRPDLQRARLHEAAVDARALGSAAMLYEPTREGECPTMRDLKQAKILDRTRPTTDPWDTEWRISCSAGRVTVTSAGPDKELDTDDDVRFPSLHAPPEIR